MSLLVFAVYAIAGLVGLSALMIVIMLLLTVDLGSLVTLFIFTWNAYFGLIDVIYYLCIGAWLRSLVNARLSRGCLVVVPLVCCWGLVFCTACFMSLGWFGLRGMTICLLNGSLVTLGWGLFIYCWGLLCLVILFCFMLLE